MSYPSSQRVYVLERYTVAASHLNWAIRLLVDYGSPAEAVTLAGAAEEVCGKPLKDSSSAKQMARKLSEMSGLPAKVLMNEKLNKLRNWLKHNSELDPPIVCAPAEMEAVTMIARGLANFALLTGSQPSEGLRFRDWLMDRRPELFQHKHVIGSEDLQLPPQNG